MGNEWPLVIFTILAQMGIGLLVMAYLTKETVGDNRKKVLIGVVLCTAASMLVSTLHLGDPAGAYRAIFHLQSSWLSREIFLLGLFFACSLFILYRVRKSESTPIGTYSLLGVLLGVSTVISMGNIYYVSSILAWMSLYTHISFLTAMLMVGGSLLAVLLTTNHEQSKETLKKVIGVNSILFVVQLVAFVMYFSYLTNSAPASANFFVNHMGLWLFAQGSLFLGVLNGLWGVRGYIKNGQGVKLYLASGFVCVLVGMMVNRYLFYASGNFMW